jgi:hypothetical protein
MEPTSKDEELEKADGRVDKEMVVAGVGTINFPLLIGDRREGLLRCIYTSCFVSLYLLSKQPDRSQARCSS